MIRVKLKWNGQEAEKRIRSAGFSRMKAAAVFLWNELRAVLNESYPPASREGEAPHRRTGRGRNALALDLDERAMKATVKLQPEGRHLKILELRRKRPWFKVTVERCWSKMRALVEGGKGV